MSAAATDPAPTPSRTGTLLGLVRKLIDYGRELAATLREHGLGPRPADTARPFGTIVLTLILARIARGLLRATALEARLLRDGPRLDAPRQPRPRHCPAATAQPRTTDPRPQPTPRPDDDATLLASPPTPEQIDAEIRRRPIGAVLADICRDLGILPSHPLWSELHLAITRERGNWARLAIDTIHRVLRLARERWSAALEPAELPASPIPGCTGPPNPRG
jgi:hypothetical protein